ncbi:hypothetical protein Asulf_02132 [Archaeoglobus sulfaticallidus PM70-1]|uniref:Thymidylate synthase/dCMP hydroxymethylase domain-containing protein n=1 Tax=Archaeoglobus sulfaticallidus PM70-1 TaxID=387631 RepID=N0BGG4_9EURY|nr:thymidylate synthase [Archaeoglobus sulfaticallidus]AGK62088.1 hypothetical protein Asulf_02132 [Archaeoglobus sulfaticallidus PM70-1]
MREVMIVSRTWEQAKEMLLKKIVSEGKKYLSRFGDTLRCEPSLVVVEKPDYFFDIEHDFSGWTFCGESYLSRVEKVLDICAEKIKSSPYTRRVSIPIWMPKDHHCRNPPAITEISLLPVKELHATAYIRSLDAYNFFMHNADFITFVLDYVAEKAGFDVGSAGFIASIPHIYLRDLKHIDLDSDYEEITGFHPLAVHLKEDYLSTAWHSAMEVVYHNGMTKRTEWGEIFEGQKESKFVQRLFIEVKNPYEHQIHDKAPFTKKYAIDYAHDYMICAKFIDRPVNERILKEGETYTYAERARYCERDDLIVDQLYTVIEKLKQDRYRRDCYVGISRIWDLKSDEPPCLRGYQFVGDHDHLKGIFYMRSNDIYGAMHANAYAFSTLTQYVAELTGFQRHKYYHFAVDAHIYGEFLKAVKEILEPETPSFFDKT